LLRFEYFSRAHFPREKIKEIIRSKLGDLASSTDLTDEMAIVVGSLAKMFCGDLVETGA
jgi:hypothetical protein